MSKKSLIHLNFNAVPARKVSVEQRQKPEKRVKQRFANEAKPAENIIDKNRIKFSINPESKRPTELSDKIYIKKKSETNKQPGKLVSGKCGNQKLSSIQFNFDSRS